MEKVMKKNTNINLDNVEKILIKNLESKKGKKNNTNNNSEFIGEKALNIEDFSKEIVDYNKSIPDDNQIVYHFNRKFAKEDLERITAFNSNKASHFKHSLKMYNQKFGEYNYTYFDLNRSNKTNNNSNNKSETIAFPRTTTLSKLLFDRLEHLDSILPEEISLLPQKKLDLNFEELFNLRFFKYLTNYSDITITNSDLFLRQGLMSLYLFHILNHLLIRKEEIEINNYIERVLKNKQNKSINNILKDEFLKNADEDFLNDYIKRKELTNFSKNEFFKEFSYSGAKIKKILQQINSPNNTDESGNSVYEQIQDQGFTFPRALILVPYKKHARLIVDEIIQILKGGNWKGAKNKKKFKEEYSEADAMNDCFRIGISFDYFNNKIKFYEGFEDADLIIASPLGVKLTKNQEGSKQEKIYDFLSSIEILLVDFAEVFTFQNISHLEEVLSVVNQMPKSNANIVDINRIKDNYKDNLGGYLRQSIFVSHFKNLEIEMLIKNTCKNAFNGAYVFAEKYQNILYSRNAIEMDIENSKKQKIGEEIYQALDLKGGDQKNLSIAAKVAKDASDAESQDSLGLLGANENDEQDGENNKIKFEFKILRSFDDMDILDNKFNFFTKNLWPNIVETFDRHTIIFAASALDYIRLKAFFKKNSIYVTYISEDNDKKDWQRNRLFFEEGRYKFLLYSERAHYYKKINLRFAKNIFFYSLPEDPKTLKEMLEMIKPSHYKYCLDKYKLEEPNNIASNYSAVISLVTKLERYNLEKAVGTDTANYIFKNKIENYMC